VVRLRAQGHLRERRPSQGIKIFVMGPCFRKLQKFCEGVLYRVLYRFLYRQGLNSSGRKPSKSSMRAMRKPKRTCRKCSATAWSNATHCHFCGVLHPTSELRAALSSPSALALSTLAVTVFITFWFWQ
jgi:hypothetical protein